MTDENGRTARKEEKELVSRSEKLPFQEETQNPRSRHNHRQLGLLKTDLLQRSRDLADQASSSADNSPAQSRRYMQAGSEISFAEYHRMQSLKLDRKIAAVTATAEVLLVEAPPPGLVEHDDDNDIENDDDVLSASTPSTFSLMYSPITATHPSGSSHFDERHDDVNHKPSVRRSRDLYRSDEHADKSDTEPLQPPIREPKEHTSSKGGGFRLQRDEIK